jgi:hypothetical protein
MLALLAKDPLLYSLSQTTISTYLSPVVPLILCCCFLLGFFGEHTQDNNCLSSWSISFTGNFSEKKVLYFYIKSSREICNGIKHKFYFIFCVAGRIKLRARQVLHNLLPQP